MKICHTLCTTFCPSVNFRYAFCRRPWFAVAAASLAVPFHGTDVYLYSHRISDANTQQTTWLRQQACQALYNVTGKKDTKCFYRATAKHTYGFPIDVCLSVRLPVKRVHCDKTKALAYLSVHKWLVFNFNKVYTLG